MTELINAAIAARADAINFHVIDHRRYVVPGHDAYELIKTLCFNREQWSRFFAMAKKGGICISAMINDMGALNLIEHPHVAVYMIHSACLSEERLVRAVARFGKPVFFGTGASSLEEMEQALVWAREEGNDQLALLHGYQAYPTAIRDANLKRIDYLVKQFNVVVGYSDHTAGDSDLCGVMSMMGLAVGACILEKHITLNRSLKGIDSQAAMNGDEFIRFVEQVRRVEEGFGKAELGDFSEEELAYRNLVKKRIVAAVSLKAGMVISHEVIDFKRAGKGVMLDQLTTVLGRRLRCNLMAEQPIIEDMLEN